MAKSATPFETYVALLRGINVGGNNVIPMAALTKTFTRLGFASVKTYIASGNVIFLAPKQDPRKLERKLEKALAQDFAYDAKVVLKSKTELDAIIKRLPRGWAKPSPAVRYYVMFLRHAIDSKRILDAFSPRPDVETLTYVPGALLWAANKDALTRSTVAKQVLAKPVYKELTIRNLTTTRKLVALAAEIASSKPASRA
jgi:uncharacterized protein (DUF1697 family)